MMLESWGFFERQERVAQVQKALSIDFGETLPNCTATSSARKR